MIIRLIQTVGIILIFLLMSAFGVNDSIMQFFGNIAGEIPVMGVWYNALSGIGREVFSSSFSETLISVLRITMVCVSSNILDSFFLGFFFSFTKIIFGTFTDGRWSDRLNLGATILSSFVGVLILWLIKRGNVQTQTLIVTISDIGIMLLGIMIMLRGRRAFMPVFFFLYDAAVGAIEAGGGIGLLCSFLLLPSLIKNGFSLMWYAWWLLSLILLILVVRFVHISRQLDENGRYF